jgi:hypothetical protein
MQRYRFSMPLALLVCVSSLGATVEASSLINNGTGISCASGMLNCPGGRQQTGAASAQDTQTLPALVDGVLPAQPSQDVQSNDENTTEDARFEAEGATLGPMPDFKTTIVGLLGTDGTYSTQGYINGSPVEFVLDDQANDFVISTEMAKAARINAQSKRPVAPGTTVNVSSLLIGPFLLQGIPVRVVSPQQLPGGKAVAGRALMAGFNVSVDGGVMLLTKPANTQAR